MTTERLFHLVHRPALERWAPIQTRSLAAIFQMPFNPGEGAI
jgi:hypothetical protein